jgi:Sulfotransferase domain.
MLLSALSLKDGTALDINAPAISTAIASNRYIFEQHTLLDTDMLTAEEIDALRPPLYRHLAKYAGTSCCETDDAPVRFTKVHDAYSRLPDGTALLAGHEGADKAILIVRDPRDLVSSLANHNGCSFDTAIEQINNPDAEYCANAGKSHRQLRQKLNDWSRHTASWLDQTDIPVCLIRYEDMIADTALELRRILDFAQWYAGCDEIEKAVSICRFENLQSLEEKNGFREKPPRLKSGQFFRKGQAGGWHKELTREQVLRIEHAHFAMMLRLGYEPHRRPNIDRQPFCSDTVTIP